MEHHISNVIKEYQDKLHEMPFVLKPLYQRDLLEYWGEANKTFLTFLFSNSAIGIQFLKDVGLIHCKLECNSCGRDRRHVTSSCWSLEHCGIWIGISRLRYARAVFRHRATSAMFSSLPLKFTEITLSWMTAAPAAIFWPTFLQSFHHNRVTQDFGGGYSTFYLYLSFSVAWLEKKYFA